MIDTASSLETISALVNRDFAWPREMISGRLIESAGFMWLGKHGGDFEDLQVDPALSILDQIDKLISSDIDTIIDDLLSIAVVMLDAIEYVYSSGALSSLAASQDEIAKIGRFSMMRPAEGDAFELSDAEGSMVTDLTRFIFEKRVVDLPMLTDHFSRIIGAIRVCLILKDAASFPIPPAHEPPDSVLAMMERLFVDGKKIEDPSTDARFNELFVDGELRFTPKPKEDTDTQPE